MAIKIGPIMTVHGDGYIPNMQDAYECDMECGSHHLNNAKSEQFNREFPTVVAMAALIEKERDLMIKFLVVNNLVDAYHMFADSERKQDGSH